MRVDYAHHFLQRRIHEFERQRCPWKYAGCGMDHRAAQHESIHLLIDGICGSAREAGSRKGDLAHKLHDLSG
jgi:hypothetical protein